MTKLKRKNIFIYSIFIVVLVFIVIYFYKNSNLNKNIHLNNNSYIFVSENQSNKTNEILYLGMEIKELYNSLNLYNISITRKIEDVYDGIEDKLKSYVKNNLGLECDIVDYADLETDYEEAKDLGYQTGQLCT